MQEFDRFLLSVVYDIPNLIFVVDTQDGTIIYANQFMRETLGAACIGRKFSEQFASAGAEHFFVSYQWNAQPDATPDSAEMPRQSEYYDDESENWYHVLQRPVLWHDVQNVLASTELGATLEQDIAILRDKLGAEYFSTDKEIRVSATKLQQIEANVHALCAKNAIAAATGAKIIGLVRRLRFEPLHKLMEPHFKAAEQLAARQEKLLAPIVYEGDMVLVDPQVYGPFCKSLIHLLRNAVDHGIEDPDTRLMADKDEVARIRCCVHTTEEHLSLTISDDGSGIDPARIRAKAVELGKLGQQEAAELIDAEALTLIFLDGLTTRSEANAISGRGVGLAAVRQELENLGGTVQLDSTLGQGTQFVFTLPHQPTTAEIDGKMAAYLMNKAETATK